MHPQFTDLCLISADVLRLVSFYETLFDTTASEKDAYHASIQIGGLWLTIDAARIAEESSAFSYVGAKASDNTIICFNVADVDAAYARVLELGAVVLCEPTTHPWGARSFQFRDADGNILNFRTVGQ
ncbi:MAG: VOC family protein [Oscillospiraceae bacterium]|jgi:predicted enzyme related to lactoylglutathione lyase|nr:VOC family protein [Oscillospiraceae bacterium]